MCSGLEAEDGFDKSTREIGLVVGEERVDFMFDSAVYSLL
jgi:hypothetical protein